MNTVGRRAQCTNDADMPFGRAVEGGEADVRARRSVRAIGTFEQGCAATISRGRTHEARDATPLVTMLVAH
jgi:hypothetical protein